MAAKMGVTRQYVAFLQRIVKVNQEIPETETFDTPPKLLAEIYRTSERAIKSVADWRNRKYTKTNRILDSEFESMTNAGISFLYSLSRSAVSKERSKRRIKYNGNAR